MGKTVLSFEAMQRYKQGKNGIQHDWEPALCAVLPPHPKGKNADKLWLHVLLIEEARDEVLAYLAWATKNLVLQHPERVAGEIRRASDRLLVLMEEYQVAHNSWNDAAKDRKDYDGLPEYGSREESIQHAQIFKREKYHAMRATAWPMGQ